MGEHQQQTTTTCLRLQEKPPVPKHPRQARLVRPKPPKERRHAKKVKRHTKDVAPIPTPTPPTSTKFSVKRTLKPVFPRKVCKSWTLSSTICSKESPPKLESSLATTTNTPSLLVKSKPLFVSSFLVS